MKIPQVIFLFVFLVSCLSNQNLPLAETPSNLPTFSPIQTQTSALPTKTLFPSETPHPPEPTFPVGQTLTFEESRMGISRMMQGDLSCLFPCWWGIVPGKTSWSYTSKVLTHLNLKSESFELQEGTEYGVVFAKDGDHVYGTVGFSVNEGIVEDVAILGNRGSDKDFSQRWEHYSLTEILKTYGQPSRFWVILVKGGEIGSSRNSYHLLVFYDEIKALIRYSGSSVSDFLCPDFRSGEVDQLYVYLQNPNKSRKLTDITNVNKMIELLDQPDVYLVEKMTESRIEEVHDLFTQKEASSCFNGIYQ